MKKIIDKKVYDTETSQAIISYENTPYTNDFGYIYETLYRTKKGNWFLHGQGGAKTQYAESLGNGSFSGGETIIPLTDNETYEWLETHNFYEEIEKYFPDKIEDA